MALISLLSTDPTDEPRVHIIIPPKRKRPDISSLIIRKMLRVCDVPFPFPLLSWSD